MYHVSGYTAVRCFPLLLLCLTIGSSLETVVGTVETNDSSFNGIFGASLTASFRDDFGPIADPLTWLKFTEAQLFPASINATFPTLPLLRIFTTGLSSDTYKLRPCARADVGSCLLYGNSSNGLPDRVQGIWWMDGNSFPEEAISTAGTYVPSQRKLSINLYGNHNWGYMDTSSVWVPFGPWWTYSAAADFDASLTGAVRLDIYFNEDFSVGQMLLGATVLGFQITVPSFIVNWTMTYQPDDTWRRDSSALGIPTPSGNYILRRAIDGNGRPARYFDDWVKAHGGRPFTYPEKL